jgi:hypothetical protein
MIYEVEWLHSALDELAGIWIKATPSQRQAITAASHAIDQQLAMNPEDHGESRPKGRRIHFSPPLGVSYRVDTLNATVLVVHVWQFRQPKG